MFDGMSQLSLLDVSHNRLTVDVDALDALSHLARLHMVNCALTTWPQALTRLDKSKLISLVLDDNPIKRLLSTDLNGLTALRKLRLEDTAITQLDMDVFRDLSQLQWLDISRVPLESLQSAVFDPLVSLKRLDFGAQLLQDKVALSNRYFEALTQLERLELSARGASRSFVQAWDQAFAAR